MDQVQKDRQVYNGLGLGVYVYGVTVLLGNFLLSVVSSIWKNKVNAIVSESYLDEFFHVRQAQLYCASNFTHWDPKITTPPGLYFSSYLLHCLGLSCDLTALRSTNTVALGLLVFLPAIRLQLGSNALLDITQHSLSKSQRLRSLVRAVHGAVNICLFPPLFFFCALYYTDVISTGLVLVFLDLRQDHNLTQWPILRAIVLIIAGLLALLFRQTNIFWVAVFPAGLEIIELLKSHVASQRNPTKSVNVIDAVVDGWQNGTVQDPPLSEAYLEDYIKLMLSVIASAARVPLQIALRMIPYIALLASFLGFIVANGGVVLGDKGNHVATIHIPQMLYIWPYIFFFSFTLIVPRLRALISIPESLPDAFLQFRLQKQSKAFPRIPVLVVALIISIAAIHYNTIVHPFTLADNRHYVFYVFRILLRHRMIKYLAAPAYIFCGWAVIWTLALPTRRAADAPLNEDTKSTADQSGSLATQKSPSEQLQSEGETRSYSTSYALIWLISTTLCLITAPLVEPRYVILPWILWRIRVAGPRFTDLTNLASPPTKSSHPPPPHSPIATQVNYMSGIFNHGDVRLYTETVWFLAINAATCYMFLYKGFEWKQEPGVVQRFMW